MKQHLTRLLAASVFALGAASVSAQPLLTAQEVNGKLTAPDVRVLDIRDPKSYGENHIPGALNAPYGAWRGPAGNPGELPDLKKLTTLVQSLGLTPQTHAIVVSSGKDETDFGAAARIYWTLKVLGLNNLSILNGGIKAWTQAGLPLNNAPVKVTASTFVPTINQDMIVTRDEAVSLVKSGKAQLVDARPSEFFKGETRHVAAKVPGTLPGATSVEHSQWFKPGSSQFVNPDEAQKLAQSLNLKQGEETINFCNTGHWAATNWFALSEVLGQKDAKMYAGSMVDWTQAPDALPMDNVPNRAKQLLIDAKIWWASK